MQCNEHEIFYWFNCIFLVLNHKVYGSAKINDESMAESFQDILMRGKSSLNHWNIPKMKKLPIPL